jgi:YD repeat-containing protein
VDLQLDEPLTVTDCRHKTTTYTYNSDGDKLSQTTPAAYETTWTYNTDGTVATEVSALGNAYGYDHRGNRLTSDA